LTAWGWFVLPLAAFAFYWPYFPDGSAVKWFAVGLTALLAVNVRRLDIVDAVAVSIPVWAALSAFWTTDPWGVMPGVLHLAALSLVFVAARRVDNFTPFLIAATVGLCAVILSSHFHPVYQGGFGNENFTTLFVIAALPLAAFLGGFAWAAVAVSFIYLLSENGSRLELAAVAGWMAYWFLSTPWTKRKAAALAVLIVGFMVVAAVMLSRDTDGLGYRVDMWRAAVAMFMDSPLLGRGMGGYETDFLWFAPSAQTVVLYGQHVYGPGSAHGDFLQVAAEFGVIGIAWLAVLIYALRKGPAWAWYAISGIFACALVDAPFQLPATALIGVVALGALVKKHA